MPTLLQRNPVALGVEFASDLLELAVSLGHVLDGGGLHEEGVGPALSDDGLHASAVGRHHHVVLVALHDAPHLGVHLVLGFLEKKPEQY